MADEPIDLDDEPIAEPGHILFNGRQFRVADSQGAMPLLRYAAVAARGVGMGDLEGMAATYEYIRSTIDPADWVEFEAHATETKARGDDLIGVARQAIGVMVGRPTVRPSDSSDGPESPTVPSSSESSSSPESSTPEDDTASIPPIQRDPRVIGLVPVDRAVRAKGKQRRSA